MAAVFHPVSYCIIAADVQCRGAINKTPVQRYAHVRHRVSEACDFKYETGFQLENSDAKTHLKNMRLNISAAAAADEKTQ